MAKKTKDEILRLAEEKDVEFIRLQFVDILGILKNVAITIEQLPAALDGKIMFDGSSIEGFTRIHESDMYLRPDYDTFVIFPWTTNGGHTARMMCDIYTPDGEPFAGCPRGTLKNVMAEAAEMGFEMFAGPEPEFFLFEKDKAGNPTTKTHDKGGYFDLSPVDLGGDARRDTVLALKDMGFEVEAAHHEVAPGQHEIDFKYTDVLRTADNIATFKFVTKIIAMQHNLHATFMPKPIHAEAGSGMHVNQSLFKEGENAFYDPQGEMGLSKIAYHYIGGLLKHAKATTAVLNPTINSYKRLVPGYEAPVYISWSGQNRSALVRVPSARGNATRVELRNPDPTANPYLALAVMLKAGLDGIKNEIDPGEQTLDNIYDMNYQQRKKRGIVSLPNNIMEAVNYLQKSQLMRETLGEHIFEHLIEAKKIEWSVYKKQVHKWEIDQYLTTY
ncbi:type I glutamate--ammonia ligase [Halanaerobium sp. Z-7514]|uniref:Glutamine synthetase n=1 Tax=Halanaerobium polyolivorans TaxID=2886943 RepID=A0AAW4WZ48_9FIRM|nr:type I glutamate--ammonia ligase [Halanaerobium polyolivorans]MCC3144412.1 type I glutamate--ammonia ligase [Halanaerobium polyolivorans]